MCNVFTPICDSMCNVILLLKLCSYVSVNLGIGEMVVDELGVYSCL